MLVYVFGPNLNPGTGEQIHVHAHSCNDCKHYGPGRRFGGSEYAERHAPAHAAAWRAEKPLEMTSRREVIEFVYPPSDFDYDADEEWEYYAQDVRFFPCVKGLPDVV